MNKLLEEEIKSSYINLIANYVTDSINIFFKYYQNDHRDSFNELYNSAFDILEIDKEEQDKLYQLIEEKLEHKYKLIKINAGYDAPLRLKKIER